MHSSSISLHQLPLLLRLLYWKLGFQYVCVHSRLILEKKNPGLEERSEKGGNYIQTLTPHLTLFSWMYDVGQNEEKNINITKTENNNVSLVCFTLRSMWFDHSWLLWHRGPAPPRSLQLGLRVSWRYSAELWDSFLSSNCPHFASMKGNNRRRR